MPVTTSIRRLQTWGKRTVGRVARGVLPHQTLTLRHVEPGLQLRVDLKRNLMFWWGGLSRFEPYSVAVFRAVIEPGDTIIDVGANVGFFTTLFSRLTGPHGRVVSFEPDPDNLTLLRANVAALGEPSNVMILAAAVGAEPGTASFSLDQATGATGHLGADSTLGGTLYGDGKPHLLTIPVETIDGVVERQGVAPALIKLDIEGGEFPALRGASATLPTNKPVVMAELGGEEGPRAMQLLLDHGYRVWNLETGEPAFSAEAHPAMIVALHQSAIDSSRSRRVLDALRALPR